MAYCSACGVELGEGQNFCASCGSKLDLSSMPTVVHETTQLSQPSMPVDGSPLVAGQVLDGRYRIIGLLGKGGMGEVYRADDLTLQQTVAIKFLTEQFAANDSVRKRFQHEVRVARQVSHPNVCRVHDIGEIDGRLYLTMEYIDGEDLASVTRRIGYLPRDKAIEISQQLCSGLAAAHKQGLLHRDLKPANVMLDGQGVVKITDFGLAGFSDQIEDIRSGTPAYMSPEQLAGKEVTVQSDIYSLGLVLYEVFTGRPAFRAESMADLQLQQASSPATPSSVIQEIDPVAESAIMRCLDPDPTARPESALAVAVSLPGGDPLAAALAAGETPTPELVAAAGAGNQLSKPWAWGMLSIVLMFILSTFFVGSHVQLVNRADPPLTKQVLEDRARQILHADGESTAFDSIGQFFYDTRVWNYIAAQPADPEREARFHADAPSVLKFWYRESPARLVPLSSVPSRTTWSDPPRSTVGMAGVMLDPQGRLLSLYRHPPQRDSEQSAPADWAPLFEAAGLDIDTFESEEPSWVPETAYDERVAWVGSHPDAPDIELRIEAAAFEGTPVSFGMIWPWTTEGRVRSAGGATTVQWITLGIMTLIFSYAGYLAFRNYQQDRGDRRGAARLAAAATLIIVIVWALVDHHQSSLFVLFGRVASALGFGLFMGGLTWMLYLAIEPAIRRRFPEKIVSWTRLLSGNWRDPIVARDILAGIAAGSLFAFGRYLIEWVSRATGVENVRPILSSIDPLNGAADVLGQFLTRHAQTAIGALAIALVWFVFAAAAQWLFKRAWIGTVMLWALLVANIISQFSDRNWIAWSFAMLTSLIFASMIERFGILGLLFAMVYGNTLVAQSMPATTSSWWSTSGFLVYAIMLILTIFFFRSAAYPSARQA